MLASGLAESIIWPTVCSKTSLVESRLDRFAVAGFLLKMSELEISNNNNNTMAKPRPQDNPLSGCDERTVERLSLPVRLEDECPKSLIPKLCKHFYNLGWASGTGGGLSIRRNGIVYCAPSGVQKEQIQPEDMFVLEEGSYKVLEQPSNPKLKISECLPLFAAAFELRNAGCCIHSHSIHAVMITLLYSRENIKFLKGRMPSSTVSSPRLSYEIFCIRNQEMIKGIKKGSTGESLQYSDELVVPIIENTRYERDLTESLRHAIIHYPFSNAILVRNHGVYVWGETWQQAKSQAECYDFLFKVKLEAVKCGLDWF